MDGINTGAGLNGGAQSMRQDVTTPRSHDGRRMGEAEVGGPNELRPGTTTFKFYAPTGMTGRCRPATTQDLKNAGRCNAGEPGCTRGRSRIIRRPVVKDRLYYTTINHQDQSDDSQYISISTPAIRRNGAP